MMRRNYLSCRASSLTYANVPPAPKGSWGHGDRALQAVVRTMAEDTGPEAFVRQQTAIMNRVDSRPGLAAIRCPTLVLVGADDTLTPPDRAGEMAAAIPGARQVVVPACGHLSPLEQPQDVTDALVAFLSS